MGSKLKTTKNADGALLDHSMVGGANGNFKGGDSTGKVEHLTDV